MSLIAYLDIEVNPNNSSIKELGLLVEKFGIKGSSISYISKIIKHYKPNYICGHNFVKHDKYFLSDTSFNPIFNEVEIIDTLYLSMLLFPHKISHKLLKPYKDEINIENNPLGDAEQTKNLFNFLDEKYNECDKSLQQIFWQLLHDNKYYKGYFIYKNISYENDTDIFLYLKEKLKDKIQCQRNEFNEYVATCPLELSFIIAFLLTDNKTAISEIIFKNHPDVVKILKVITFNKELISGDYLTNFAKNEFGFTDFKFRKFDKANNDIFNRGVISQKDIIQDSSGYDSVLAILPTGGGKTFTFQLPALIKAQAYKSLTVVISPLQALMKDQIQSFKDKNQNFIVTAVSGFLSPIERLNNIEEVRNGNIDILYLAPESLRANTVISALKKRIIERFVIDEAHCLSTWGHDFRHDYFYISTIIKELQTEKHQHKIPVSCFTATAKPEVILDIKKHFADKLAINFTEFIGSAERENLNYKAIKVNSVEEKYNVLIEELQRINENKKVATIIYIPHNAKKCRDICEQLLQDPKINSLDLVIETFYSKLDEDIENGKKIGRNKNEILDDFIENKIDVVVATTAFGMGIDKPNIQAVIHFEQSDSLESYIQESGRGARDEKLEAECIVLYSIEDFNRAFNNLNRSKVGYPEITSVVKYLKKINLQTIYKTPKEIAEKMGIDTEDSKIDYKTTINTAIAELENHNILTRGQNKTRIFATSFDDNGKRMDRVHEILDPLEKEKKLDDCYKDMILVMQNISNRSKLDVIEIDDLASIVGVDNRKMYKVMSYLTNAELLKFDNDISIFINNENDKLNKEFEKHFKLEWQILEKIKKLPEYEKNINLRYLNDFPDTENHIKQIKKIVQSWQTLAKIKTKIFNVRFKKDHCYCEFNEGAGWNDIEKQILVRQNICEFIKNETIALLEEKIKNKIKLSKKKDEVELSTINLKVASDNKNQKISITGFHHCIVYLHNNLDNFQLRKGRLIYHQAYKIIKQEGMNINKPYQQMKHYNQTLKPYYERKIEAVHILIKFLTMLVKDSIKNTKSYVADYFVMDYKKFKKKYKFDESKIKLPITQERLNAIIKDLNSEQKKVFDDVYICIENNFFQNDYDKRLFYVAISRAKNHLSINLKNNNFLSSYQDEIINYDNIDAEPKKIVFMMGLGDISLVNEYSQRGVERSNPMAGEIVNIKEIKTDWFCVYKNNAQIASLSKANDNQRLSYKIIQKIKAGYVLNQEAKVEHVVVWTNKDDDKKYHQVLCKIYMQKKNIIQ
ncbi:MAG: hypothetical protein DRQ51_03940 [Gammaproteobacteria bacterium]|nr:MAG: hypothetical protein DRQ51_03940 [Gammaproteobacteria bacterium]